MDRIWFFPVVLISVAADCFILLIPADALMLALVWIKPKRWLPIAIWFALGTAIGAASFDFAFDVMGFHTLEQKLRAVISPENFLKMDGFFKNYGTLALGFVAFGPFPIQPIILIAAIGKVSTVGMFISMFIGRLGKNIIVCSLAAYAPDKLKKILRIGQKKSK